MNVYAGSLFMLLTLSANAVQPAAGLPTQVVTVFGRYSDQPRVATVLDGENAYCLSLDQAGLRLCSIAHGFEPGQKDYLELRLLRGASVFGRLLTAYTAYSAETDFDAGFADLDGDGRAELIAARQISCGNGIVICSFGLAVFVGADDYRLSDSLVVKGLRHESGFYRRGTAVYFEESDWIRSDRIDNRAGTYLAANWYRWQGGRFVHDITLPVAVRRFLRSFQHELYQQHAEGAYPWFVDPRARRFGREELLRQTAEMQTDFPALFAGPQRESELRNCASKEIRFGSWAPCPVD
jgi:hypothetical protein